ncbi:prolipoprotein diacylglyceryl transferase [uncultured Traorella sp.]|uniref:prolipoprotein diacylglyceryl transferase n=1 Tax=uncultured Traorella sp. TaxID=1929048 RepID=UPI0025E5EF0F|nr:prolipoprotein diacylglyceryl transferase [uncultured Traorella sp.]
MYNDLITFGSLTIHSYGLLIAIGLFSGYLIAEKRAKKANLNTDELLNLFFVCMLGCVVGGKLLYCIVEYDAFSKDPALLFDFENGFVIYGGLLGALLGGYQYCRFKGLSFLKYFEIFVPSLAWAQGFGRIGCFLAGCCYGKPTDAWYGIAFHHSQIAPNHVALIPTQLISSAFDFLLAGFLFYLASKNKRTGTLLSVYLIVYSIGRFMIEFLRNDERGFVGFLSTSQLISVFTLLLGIYIYFKCTKKVIMDSN